MDPQNLPETSDQRNDAIFSFGPHETVDTYHSDDNAMSSDIQYVHKELMGRELLTPSRAARFTSLMWPPRLPIFLSNSQYPSFICLSICSNPGPCPAISLPSETQLHILTLKLPPEYRPLFFPAGLGLTSHQYSSHLYFYQPTTETS